MPALKNGYENQDKPKQVTILGGFLGAGKTSYLNQLLKSGKVAQNALVLVNDFGAINLDFELIESKNDQQVMQLSNGCICCSLRGSLADKLYQLESETWFSEISEIYIETSGIAKPKPIIDTLKLANQMQLAEYLVLVDGSAAQRWSQDAQIGDIWRAQLECADRVLINRLLPAALDRITARIKPSCQVDILEKIKSTETQMQPLVTPQTNSRQNVGKLARQIHQGKITSVSFSDLKLHDKDKFNTILLAYRAVVLRAKGYVCWQGQSYLVQLSGAKIAWSKLPSPPKRFDFVVIGKQGDVFDECMTQLSKESELL